MLDTANSEQLSFGPPPEWANVRPFSRTSQPEPVVFHGSKYWISSQTVRLGVGPQIWLSRNVTEVAAPDALQSAASVEIIFSPVWERVVVHHVLVIRDGQARNVGIEGAFEILRRERDMERATFDGRLTAILVAPDVRVGDVVDVCYSIVGANPVFEGRFAAYVDLQWEPMVGVAEVCILAPPERRFSVSIWGPKPVEERSTSGGLLRRRWSVTGGTGFRYEPHTPSHWIGHTRLLIGDTLSWTQVAETYLDRYRRPGAMPADLDARIQAIKRASSDPKVRTAEALRMVQSDIRYLSMSTGLGGLVPRAAPTVWESRFGDCKDVSVLLATVLSAMEIKAVPALVNTFMGLSLAQQPVMIAFNHCIVRVQLGDEVFWLDPTRSLQSGPLDQIAQARFDRALPLASGATLETIPPDPVETILDVRQDIHFGPQRTSPAKLEVECAYRTWRADDMRRRLLSEGREAVAKAFREYYGQSYGEISTLEPLAVTDDPAGNILKTREVYELAKPWQLSKDEQLLSFTSMDETVRQSLPIISGEPRRAPIAVGSPRRLTQTTTLHMPKSWGNTPFSHSWDIGPVHVATAMTSSGEGRTIILTSSVTIDAPLLSAKDAKAYHDMLDPALTSAGVAVTHPANSASLSRTRKKQGVGDWWPWIWLILVAVGVLRAVAGF